MSYNVKIGNNVQGADIFQALKPETKLTGALIKTGTDMRQEESNTVLEQFHRTSAMEVQKLIEKNNGNFDRLVISEII